MRTLKHLLLMLPLMALVGSVAYADSDKDHDKARQILAKKEILPLDQVLAKVRAEVPGDVIDVELEDEDDGWIYEFKIIEPSGKVVKIEADAKNGTILKTTRK